MDSTAKQGYHVKAQEFMQKAQKKTKVGLFGKLTGQTQDRLEEACGYYENAAQHFKLAGDWEKAAEAYILCAETSAKTGNIEPNYYIEAANAIKKVNNATYIEHTNTAIEIYVNQGRFGQAARMRKQIAETYEKDMSHDLAAQNYKVAAELLEMEPNSELEKNRNMLKWVELSTYDENADIKEPIQVLEDIAKSQLSSTLGRHQAPKLFHQASLLYLVNNDTIGTKNALEDYADQDPQYASGRSYALVTAMLKAVDENSVQAFEDTLFDYNKITPFTKWEEKILVRVKKMYFPEGQGAVNVEGGLTLI